MKKLFAPLICVALLSGCVVHVNGHGDGPSEHFTQNLTLPAGNLEQLNIDAGAGELNVIGVAGLESIEVEADIWSHSNEGEEFTFSLEKRGNKAQLVGKHRSRRGFHINFNRSARIDMTVRVPARLMLDIEDGSGDMNVSNILGEVKIDDESGSIELSKLGSDLTIIDGSGDLVASKVQGNVKIDDDSGSIDLNGLSGNLSIEDGSGSIVVDAVQGNIDVNDDSGELRISHVGGNVTIEDGSGDIVVSDVDKRVKIDDDSGDIIVKRVTSLRIVDDGSGDVSVQDVESYAK